MNFRRDGISGNVEISGELDEILERTGERTSLEDLKQHLQNPTRQKEMLQKWLHEQEHWLQKLPQLLESLGDEQEGLQKVLSLLQGIDQAHGEELQALLTFLDIEANEETYTATLGQLRQSLQQYQEIRAKIAQELPEGISQVLNTKPLAQKLERTTEVEEAADPLN